MFYVQNLRKFTEKPFDHTIESRKAGRYKFDTKQKFCPITAITNFKT